MNATLLKLSSAEELLCLFLDAHQGQYYTFCRNSTLQTSDLPSCLSCQGLGSTRQVNGKCQLPINQAPCGNGKRDDGPCMALPPPAVLVHNVAAQELGSSNEIQGVTNILVGQLSAALGVGGADSAEVVATAGVGGGLGSI